MNTRFASAITSAEARRRMLAMRGEPLFYARWDRAVFLHYECDPAALQKCVPFPIDCFNERAFVSVVAFTMQRMRPRFGSSLSELLLRPIAIHHFLNVRTYVHHDGEPGIYFMAEWLSNRLSVLLGPITFGLPYRFGKIEYNHADKIENEVRGNMRAKRIGLNYRARLSTTDLETSEPETLDEFLLERYTAYTSRGSRRRFFRVWHEPWQQARLEAEQISNELLPATGSWASTAQYSFGNYSPGADVWLGWPHQIGNMN